MGKKRRHAPKVQELSESEEEYEIEKILDRRERNGVTEYFLKWKGFSSLENSWEPETNLNCQDLIQEFNSKCTKEEEEQDEVDSDEEPLVKKSKLLVTDEEKPEEPPNLSDADENNSTVEKESEVKEPTTTEDTEENKESEGKRKRKSKSIQRGSSGFDRGWEVDEILGATHSYGRLHFLISWKGKDQAELVPAKIAHKKSPQAVIDYYEARLQWCDREERAETSKSNNEETSSKVDK